MGPFGEKNHVVAPLPKNGDQHTGVFVQTLFVKDAFWDSCAQDFFNCLWEIFLIFHAHLKYFPTLEANQP